MRRLTLLSASLLAGAVWYGLGVYRRLGSALRHRPEVHSFVWDDGLDDW